MASPINLEAGIDFTVTTTTQKFALGIEVPANDGCTYKYVRAGGAITALNFVIVDVAEGPYDVVHCSAVSQAIAGVAPVAIADNSFGWIKVKGKQAGANVTTGETAGAMLGTSGTEGRLVEITAATPSNAEVIAAIAAAVGVGVIVQVTAASNAATVVLI